MPVIARFVARANDIFAKTPGTALVAVLVIYAYRLCPPAGAINSIAAIAIAARILPPPDLEPAAIGVIIISPSRRGNKHSKGLSSSCPPTSI